MFEMLDDSVEASAHEGSGCERQRQSVSMADCRSSFGGRHAHGVRTVDADYQLVRERQQIDARTTSDIEDRVALAEQVVRALLVGADGGPRRHLELPVGGAGRVSAGVDVSVGLAHSDKSRKRSPI
jgi:hypothetical protein